MLDNTAIQETASEIAPARVSNKYETEHPPIWMPFTVTVNGHELKGVGLSLVNAIVSGHLPPDAVDRNMIATFTFLFQGYSFNLPADVLIAREFDRPGSYRITFLNPTGPHLPHLRYLMNSYLAGDLVVIDELLRVRSEKNGSPNAAKAAPSRNAAMLMRRASGVFLVSLATLGLVALVGYTLQKRVFVHEVPSLATIEPVGLPLRAPEAGQIVYVNDQAAQGDVVFSLQSVRGEALNFTNPCDCSVFVTPYGETGATVLPGEVIAYVEKGGDEPVLKATMPSDLTKKLMFGGRAVAILPDGSKVALNLTSAMPIEGSSQAESAASFTAAKGVLRAAGMGSTLPVEVIDRTYARFLAAVSKLFGGQADVSAAGDGALQKDGEATGS
ncbi:hypothetical protein FJU08_19745 [Martelella alba]|uniref:HlyD family secretion protein n=1 Tax=Martelella alba TaxID=2590451 RepID=A0A506U331_9HYPH|nr:hypothetical protein [Martelella alba]TPW27671.1 hypothetical protein FJU08_19745 [Martelella alba]